jgi:rhamnose utilization protein RhaD (predicted bifunctional aldolase and dehydrogenase)
MLYDLVKVLSLKSGGNTSWKITQKKIKLNVLKFLEFWGFVDKEVIEDQGVDIPKD